MRQPMRSTGPACEGPDQADQSLASLAKAGKADTVSRPSSRVAEAQSNPRAGGPRCSGRVAGRALRCFDGAGMD